MRPAPAHWGARAPPTAAGRSLGGGGGAGTRNAEPPKLAPLARTASRESDERAAREAEPCGLGAGRRLRSADPGSGDRTQKPGGLADLDEVSWFEAGGKPEGCGSGLWGFSVTSFLYSPPAPGLSGAPVPYLGCEILDEDQGRE